MQKLHFHPFLIFFMIKIVFSPLHPLFICYFLHHSTRYHLLAKHGGHSCPPLMSPSIKHTFFAAEDYANGSLCDANSSFKCMQTRQKQSVGKQICDLASGFKRMTGNSFFLSSHTLTTSNPRLIVCKHRFCMSFWPVKPCHGRERMAGIDWTRTCKLLYVWQFV